MGVNKVPGAGDATPALAGRSWRQGLSGENLHRAAACARVPCSGHRPGCRGCTPVAARGRLSAALLSLVPCRVGWRQGLDENGIKAQRSVLFGGGSGYPPGPRTRWLLRRSGVWAPRGLLSALKQRGERRLSLSERETFITMLGKG